MVKGEEHGWVRPGPLSICLDPEPLVQSGLRLNPGKTGRIKLTDQGLKRSGSFVFPLSGRLNDVSPFVNLVHRPCPARLELVSC